MVIFTLWSMVLIGMLAVIIDAGFAYAKYRQMQVAADWAALAGAKELIASGDQDQALARVSDILVANSADATDGDEAGSTATINNNEVAVTAHTTYNALFAPILGLDQIPVSATATAVVGRLAEANNIMPFAVEQGLWAPGQVVVLWGDKNGPGNFGWVRWQGQSPSTTNLRANIDNPARSDTLAIGDTVQGHPGVSFNAVESNLSAWIGKTVTVFLYDPAEVQDSGANLTYTVRGFAHFRMTSVSSHGQDSEIQGEFLTYLGIGGAVDQNGSVGDSAIGLLE